MLDTITTAAITACTVLYSLCMDASAANESFAEWCANLGFDDDSISAFSTYQACEKIGREMKAFFGRDAVRQFEELTRDY